MSSVGSHPAAHRGPHETDVCIIGAGPAGTAAAITLARHNLRIVVLDKATFPRDKCCGDGLTTGALRRLEHLGFDPASVLSWTPADLVHVRSPGGHQITLDLPRHRGNYAVIAPRRELDAALVDLARAAGADVREHTGLSTVQEHDDHVAITCDDGTTITAPHVIAADGMWSPTRKALGIHEPYLGEWHAFRQYHSHVGPAAQRDLWIWFEPDINPGYVWSFPLPDGRANVGFGIERTADTATGVMKHLWPELLRRPHIAAVLGPDAVADEAPRAWPIPCDVGSARLVHGRTLFVGDAARMGDVLTGEGIGQALEGGTAAAEAICAHRIAGPAAVGAAYEAVVRATLQPDHRMASVLQGWLHRSWVSDTTLRIIGSTAWTRANFARWLFEDEPRSVLLTPSRFHRRFLARDGAFRDT